MKLQENGLLEPGLHHVTVPELQEVFVSQFDTSQRREEIFNTFISFINGLLNDYNIYEVWIDGSFVTSKINPNDVDIVIFFEVEDFIKISKDWNNIRSMPNIDAYSAVAVNDRTKAKLRGEDNRGVINNRNYWRGQFGFDRGDNPKGILVITGDEFSRFADEGRNEDVINVNKFN